MLQLNCIPHLIDFINDTNNKEVPLKKSHQQNYTFINYKKLNLNQNSIYGLCRSILLNKYNEVITISPFKSLTYEYFMNVFAKEDIIAMEFIEGTMINLFWTSNLPQSSKEYYIDGHWEISTKTIIGGNNNFYKNEKYKSFKMMFDEACLENNVNIYSFNKLFCYSFVLQHPENRIVVPFDKPQLYIIQMYQIDNSDITNPIIHYYNVNQLKQYGIFDNTTVKYPEIYDMSLHTPENLIKKYASSDGFTSYKILGVVFYNIKFGERTKIRNPLYEKVRKLRGNAPKLEYHYLNLRQTKQITEFLKYYPENTGDFIYYQSKINNYTNELLLNYKKCFIKKKKKLMEYSTKFKCHMYNLHKLYINELKNKQLYITFNHVKNYVNHLPPALLMFHYTIEDLKPHN